eukprot:NODE_67_length_23829_cov_0.557059.p14 type:complete len:207 gc:universal NODE_67_length_23829_cov_0.557059:3712-4332(+)
MDAVVHHFTVLIRKIINSCFTTTAILQYLRQTLEDGLLYIHNTPRIYQNNDELLQEFSTQLDLLKSLFNKLKKPSTLPSSSIAVPDEIMSLVPLYLPELSDVGWTELKKNADILYIDHQRRIMQNNQKIPKYIYFILLLLGWNELMMVISNPIYLVLMSFIGISVIVTIQLGMMPIAQHMIMEGLTKAVEFVKDKVYEKANKNKQD